VLAVQQLGEIKGAMWSRTPISSSSLGCVLHPGDGCLAALIFRAAARFRRAVSITSGMEKLMLSFNPVRFHGFCRFADPILSFDLLRDSVQRLTR